jgi:hypothetical protein
MIWNTGDYYPQKNAENTKMPYRSFDGITELTEFQELRGEAGIFLPEEPSAKRGSKDLGASSEAFGWPGQLACPGGPALAGPQEVAEHFAPRIPAFVYLPVTSWQLEVETSEVSTELTEFQKGRKEVGVSLTVRTRHQKRGLIPKRSTGFRISSSYSP